MQQYLPKDGFRWANNDLNVTNIIKEVENIDEKSLIGMVLEVDVSYPHFLHDEHKDLPNLKNVFRLMESSPNVYQRYSQKINILFIISHLNKV